MKDIALPRKITLEDKEIFDDVVKAILSVLGDDAVKIILYGSVARGDNTWESDVDIAVLTKIKIDRDTRNKLSNAMSKFSLEHDSLFSVIAIEENYFNEWLFDKPLYFNIDEEGIILWTRDTV